MSLLRSSRHSVLVALVAVALALALVTASAVAVSEPRQRPATTSPPVTVYVSEELDISDVLETDGGRLEDDPATFQRVNGTENFTVENPEEANFTNVTPGLYDLQGDTDDRPELDVVQPRVTRLVLETRDGTNVTNGTVRADRIRTLTVVAEYDFERADRLQITMHHEGEDVGLNQRAARLTESPDRYTIGMSERPPGTYTVTVTGSAIEAGTRSATVQVVPRDATATATATATRTATATEPATETATRTATATEPATPSPTATEGEGPGPGLAGALLAVALAAVALRRRA